MDRFDVVVLGAGSAGENLALELGRAGRTVALVEQHRVGGECPFTACMPSKAMLRSGEVRHLLGRVRDLGAMADPVTPVQPDRGFAQAVARRDEIAAHRDDTRHADGVRDAGVTLVRGDGTVVEPGSLAVGDRRLAYDDLVISTGAESVRPPIDGLDDVATWTSVDAWSADERPASLLVVGGGAVGCEIAQLYARFGVDVTLVEMTDRLTGGEAVEVSDALAGVLRDDGVQVRTGVQVTRVAPAPAGAAVHLGDGTTVTVERIVLATGVAPRLDGLGLERLGLDVSEGLEVDERCRVVGADHLWAAGDVTMVAPFTHLANYQARVVAGNLLGRDVRADYRAVPRTMYTDPPVVGVGLTPDAADEQGRRVVVATADLADLPRTSAAGDAGGCLVLVADRDTGVLAGASAIGPMADAWIHEAVLAVRAGIGVELLHDTIHAFPSYAEAYDVAVSGLLDQLTAEG